MTNVFISYAREDEKTALKIYEKLVSEGFSVWMDKKNLLPGQDWKTEIEKAIRGSDIFIAFLSNHSVNKTGFVQAELKRALDVADLMPEGKIFIIPVRLDECQVPYKLQSLQWVNYFEPESKKNLFKAIRSKVSAEENLEKELTEFLFRNSPETLNERFRGVSKSKIIKALLSIAKRDDELLSVRSRSVRGLSLLNVLNSSTWSELIPTASTELFAEWIKTWGDINDKTILEAEHIKMILATRRLPKSSTGFGKAIRKFIERGARYTSSVLLPGSKYPYWEVKYDCVRTVIALDDSDSLQTLASFSTMSYWKARRRIVEYIEKRYDAGKLTPEDTRVAIGILEQIVTDGKTEENTPTMSAAREVLSKIVDKAL